MNFMYSRVFHSSAGDVRNFVSNTQQTQLLVDDITIVESTELDIDNEIITSRNDSLHRVKQVITGRVTSVREECLLRI